MERLDGENVSNVLTVFVSLSQAPSAKVRAKHIKVALNSSIYLTNTHIQLYFKLSRRAEGTCSEPTLGSTTTSKIVLIHTRRCHVFPSI